MLVYVGMCGFMLGLVRRSSHNFLVWVKVWGYQKVMIVSAAVSQTHVPELMFCIILHNF